LKGFLHQLHFRFGWLDFVTVFISDDFVTKYPSQVKPLLPKFGVVGWRCAVISASMSSDVSAATPRRFAPVQAFSSHTARCSAQPLGIA
jgi:hypothetical protein